MSINYELAKELKDAGFPQRGHGTHVFPEIDTGEANEVQRRYAPTLEELIEACGEEMPSISEPDKKIRFVLYNKNPNVWISGYYKVGNFGVFDFAETGSEPIEAVARLWLVLHKK